MPLQEAINKDTLVGRIMDHITPMAFLKTFSTLDHDTTYNGITVNDFESIEVMAQKTVNGWMNSPGHRKNILTSTFDREGIGVGIASE